MNNEQQVISHKEVYSSNPINVFYVIQRFPNFEGYTGGGAERHLERLIEASQNKYDNSYQPKLYVANKQLEANQLEIPIIADPERTNLLAELKAINAPDQILHLSDSYLMTYNPKIFAEVASFWRGPIIQRVTLISRIHDLSQKYADAFQEYIAPITKFVSQSSEMSSELIKLGITPEKIVEIENGVDTEFFYPVDSEEKQKLKLQMLPEIRQDAKIFVSIARLTDPVKKIDLLIQKWQETMRGENAHLILVGGYRPEETVANSKVAELFESATKWKSNEDGIIFTGTQTAKSIKELLQLSDVFLAPSILEGFSNVALEAMSCGLPILARQGVSGYGKLILNRKTGLFFNNDEALGHAIPELHHNASLCDQLRAEARNHIVRHYSIEAMIEKYRQLYIDEINNKK